MIEKIAEKTLAIKLRKDGLTYTEILKRVPVAKSSLSLWLRSVGLAKVQKQVLTEKRRIAQQKGTARVTDIRIERTKLIKDGARREALALRKDIFWAFGVALYWAEGTKNKEWSVSKGVQICNMDATLIKIFVAWAKKYLGVRSDAFVYELYIHRTANLGLAKSYWSDELKITRAQIRYYYKKPNLNPKRNNRFSTYHGLMKVWIRKSTDANRRIEGWTEGVIEYLGYSRVV